MRHALVGALLIAAVSTLGDFVWAGMRLRHHMVFGLTHGAVLFLSIGAYLGSIARQPLQGAVGGALVGLVAAGSFYVLAPTAGYSVMFGVWAFIWFALAILMGRILPAQVWSWPETLARAALAMIGAGMGFYLISGIWRPFDPKGWDYGMHFLSWTLAYLPGFLALLIKR
jgi:hypothetical protein